MIALAMWGLTVWNPSIGFSIKKCLPGGQIPPKYLSPGRKIIPKYSQTIGYDGMNVFFNLPVLSTLGICLAHN